MATYTSDGKKLLGVEYDDEPQVNDIVDGMRVLSKDTKDGEYILFLLDFNGSICCYVLDEIYIIGKVDGFENLQSAINTWLEGEI